MLHQGQRREWMAGGASMYTLGIGEANVCVSHALRMPNQGAPSGCNKSSLWPAGGTPAPSCDRQRGPWLSRRPWRGFGPQVVLGWAGTGRP